MPPPGSYGASQGSARSSRALDSPPVKRVALAFVLAAVAAGCGKPGDYSAEKSRACLAKRVRVSAPRDFVASTATGGAFVATLRDNFVTVAFGDSTSDADGINQAYHRFSAKNVGVDDVLRQTRNVVLLWHVHPSDADANVVQSCLK